MAENNAYITLNNKEKDKYNVLTELKEVLKLDKYPRKIEWYEEFKPKVKFRHSKKEIIESFKGKLQSISKNCYQVQGSNISAYYTGNVYEGGKLFTQCEKVKKFIAYAEPSG
jgi:excinuclease UvrABC nuclease subunit